MYRWEVNTESIDEIIYTSAYNVPPRISFYPDSYFLLNKSAYIKIGLQYGDPITIIYFKGDMFISRAVPEDDVQLNFKMNGVGLKGYYGQGAKEMNVYDKSFLLTDECYYKGRRMYKLEPTEIRDYTRNK